jgi:hypothetical protein
MNAMGQAVVASPEWWLRRLHKQIAHRCEFVEMFDDYYRGDHPLPWLAPQARDEFRRILRMTRSNYMGLVCRRDRERLQIEGFRLPGQENADAGHVAAVAGQRPRRRLRQGDARGADRRHQLHAGPAERHRHPRHLHRARLAGDRRLRPGSNRRKKAAGLKLWVDDWTGLLCATLYLPGCGSTSSRPSAEGRGAARVAAVARREVRGESGRRATRSAWCRWSSCRTTRGC